MPRKRLKEAGIQLLIEPINHRDIPGFFLNTSRQALAIIERVGSDNLYLQYDIYHMQVMEGDLARTIETNLGRIAHIQIADNPGRNEPGTGEINYPFLYEHIDRIGYTGWVGAEYKPKAGTRRGLGWFAEFAGKGSAAGRARGLSGRIPHLAAWASPPGKLPSSSPLAGRWPGEEAIFEGRQNHGNDRLRRTRHHGRADGGASARRRLCGRRQRPSRRAARSRLSTRG